MISIIMGIYNGESTVEKAIDSIIDQTYKDWEYIICDDCSTDNTFKILKEYAKKDKRIRIINNNTNSGLAASLNHCLEYVTGEYIARMDCDDISTADRLEKQVAFLESHPELDVCGTYMQAFDENGLKNIIPNKQKPTKYDLPKGAPFYHATILIRTAAMKALNGYCVSKHTERTEDVDLWYRFYSSGFCGENIDEPLYLVRLDNAAQKRRKLKYMFHASYIMWYGCGMINLPFYYRFYCIKPIMSWLLSSSIKHRFKKYLIK